MSYASPKHHAKHPRITWGDASYHEYQVSATPKNSNENYEGQRILDAPMAEVVVERLDQYYPQHHAKTTHEKYQVNEDVNSEAEEFIKLEHKKFARSNTWMSFKSG